MNTEKNQETKTENENTYRTSPKSPKDLFYHVILKSSRKFENDDGKEFETDDGRYEPEARDLIAISNVRPKCIADLRTPKRS